MKPALLHNAMACCAELEVRVKRLLVDNGAAFPSKAIAAAYEALGVQLKFARSNQPHQRFIQSALHEWALWVDVPELI